ncbi:hypothetical protein Pint_15493 [Pistacia integerrima]|uniref:Uncharacterized protein n=1 Tax=Pistacia integerrima TaxID=434235 RepID=A0ACC0Z9K4_9ROSI|nr:hypothetical protein Pint_15493 [Pistacia integerrima]
MLSGSYYTVVVDCGSTGTRVNVYQWKKYVESENFPILMHSYPDNSTEGSLRRSSCQYHCLQTEPGLDKFVGNASGVRASLEPLILWAERLVLDDVEAVVKEHSFLYKKSWIRVLSGKEEAYYGWVALNYKMGSLTNSSRTSTLGLLDLGGSSLQVVMEDDAIGDDKHLIRSEIGLIEHRILAFSLPAFGLNEAFDRTVAILNSLKPPREGTRDRIEIRHPCLRSDFVQNYTCYGCVQQNITNKKNSSSQMQRTNSASVYLVGDPNWEQCRGLARAVAINSSNLDWSHPTVGTNCKAGLSSSSSFPIFLYEGKPAAHSAYHVGINILNLTAITHPTGHFHALSGFFVVYNKLNLSSRANLTKVWEKGEQLCPRSWADLSYNAGNQNHAVQHCFQVPYMASLIEEALCLGEAEIIFGPGDLSWTLVKSSSLCQARKVPKLGYLCHHIFIQNTGLTRI